LYGGRVVYYPPEPPIDRSHSGDVAHPAVKDLEGMELGTLRGMATCKGIPGAAKLSKAKLIEKLRAVR
jgi:hypothetical protein